MLQVQSIARLLEFSIAIGKVVLLPGGARRGSGSPCGGSILITSAGLGHQQSRVWPLIDLAKIEHA
jgi:hypothetical protein